MGARDQRRMQLFLQAKSLDGWARREFLDHACAEDAGLRRELESLLAQNAPAPGILERAWTDEESVAAGVTATTPRQPETEPGEIGPYRLLEIIGEGGMGVVYLAEQRQPIRRRVAIKLIKRGMDSRQVAARFEAERQALALMDHPNIARVFDAGTTEQGQPYFAMEYVSGVPITEHCDAHRLSTRERVELFIHICSGVQHAHQKGIIHRDLKPSNVLVTFQDVKAVPKIIDFGVAKATQQPLTESTLFTVAGALIGTPEYMSPEQAQLTSQDIDTRSDVYSLGVLLYELLVGVLPFDRKELQRAGFDEIRRKIREVEPSRPSTRLGTLGDDSRVISGKRRSTPGALRRELQGDLDWITMRALEKDRTRRYQSPSELASDLERHLHAEPVLAGPPSASYRLRKFVMRHRVATSFAAFVMLALMAVAGTMVVQGARIARERDRANREARAAERVSGFLSNMLAGVEPQRMGSTLRTELRRAVGSAWRTRGSSPDEVERVVASLDGALFGVNLTNSALELLDAELLARAGAAIESGFSDDPAIAARLRLTLAGTYRTLGLHDRAEPHALAALELRRRLLGDDAPDTFEARRNLFLLRHSQGRYREALEIAEDVLRRSSATLGPEHPITLTARDDVALGYIHIGREGMARDLALDTLDACRRVLGEDSLETARASFLVGFAEWRLEDQVSAERHLLPALDVRTRLLGPNHPDTFDVRMKLVQVYEWAGRYEEAHAAATELLEDLRSALGDDHPHTLWVRALLALGKWHLGQRDEAEHDVQQVVADAQEVLSPFHPTACFALYNMACAAAGEAPQKALDFLEQSAEAGMLSQGLLDQKCMAPLREDPRFTAISKLAEERRRELQSRLENATRPGN